VHRPAQAHRATGARYKTHLSAAGLDHELARQVLGRLRLQRANDDRPVERIAGNNLS
jgi:hypothetical protein